MIAKNLVQVIARIREAELRFSRKPCSVSLLAVSKKQSVGKIQEAIEAGQVAFGESYLQEALIKIPQFQVEWHFIGSIQSNKTRKIAEQFSWVHTVSDIHVARRLSQQRPQHLPPLNICLQVNISQEAEKSGIAIEDVEPLAAYCSTLANLKLRGLMAIPAYKKDFMEQRTQFHLLKLLWDELNKKQFHLDTLSMGMSEDFEAAIAEGATLVRIGSAIFGQRA